MRFVESMRDWTDACLSCPPYVDDDVSGIMTVQSGQYLLLKFPIPVVNRLDELIP